MSNIDIDSYCPQCKKGSKRYYQIICNGCYKKNGGTTVMKKPSIVEIMNNELK